MLARPNFLVIGAAKSATTSLCHILGQHPEIFMSTPKETNFFAHDNEYAKGIDYYNHYFENVQGEIAIGEGSPTYTYCNIYPNAAARIAEHLPHTKLIYIVRNPLDRARSHWLQVVSNGHFTPRSLADGFRASPRCIDASLYWSQLSAFREYFSDDRFLILFFEDFATNPTGILRRCLTFLGVNDNHDMSSYLERRNTTSESYQDRRATRLLRQIPSLSSLGMKLPISIRTAARTLFRKKMSPHQSPWDSETWQWVRNQVEDDVKLFLDYVGKPSDYWNLDWRGENNLNSS
ncbi:MAG: sulfotransferase domain-containing protein [Firmicutes bacterium]|nr:sulfotransferase domain-containing protein [Bacillota bacterium]